MTDHPLCRQIEQALPVGDSFDLLRHDFTAGGVPASLYFVDGFSKDGILSKLMDSFVRAPTPDACLSGIPWIEIQITGSVDTLVTGILSGQSVLVIEGRDEAALMDTRQYPSRSIEEPENDRVLRGPREGFTETLLFNTVLIRRRLRDPALTFHWHPIGAKSRTDVAVAFLKGRSDPKFVRKIEDRLRSLRTDALSMGQESLAELLTGRRAKWNPFPKIRYTERPDTAAAMLLEGSVLLLCDCYPAAMILPTSIFDFMQESDDFYFPPLIGTYIRLTRVLVFTLSLITTPTWYLLISHPQWIPPWLSVILIQEPVTTPIIVQLLLAELAIDGLKLASLNTPSMLNNSLSVVGGLILGDFAVQSGWFCPDVILYMAIVAIANFTQQSYELGYAFKFMRILTLIATAVFGLAGYIGGFVLTILLIAFNKTVDGSRSYLYPVIPFNAGAFRRMLIKNR